MIVERRRRRREGRIIISDEVIERVGVTRPQTTIVRDVAALPAVGFVCNQTRFRRGLGAWETAKRTGPRRFESAAFATSSQASCSMWEKKSRLAFSSMVGGGESSMIALR